MWRIDKGLMVARNISFTMTAKRSAIEVNIHREIDSRKQ
jgi:hypothetical protein